MRTRFRFRSVGLLAVLGTAAAMAATMALAAPGGASAGEKTYTASFNTECVVAPGVLNIKAKEPLKVTLSATGPEEVETGPGNHVPQRHFDDHLTCRTHRIVCEPWRQRSQGHGRPDRPQQHGRRTAVAEHREAGRISKRPAVPCSG